MTSPVSIACRPRLCLARLSKCQCASACAYRSCTFFTVLFDETEYAHRISLFVILQRRPLHSIYKDCAFNVAGWTLLLSAVQVTVKRNLLVYVRNWDIYIHIYIRLGQHCRRIWFPVSAFLFPRAVLVAQIWAFTFLVYSRSNAYMYTAFF